MVDIVLGLAMGCFMLGAAAVFCALSYAIIKDVCRER